jgi:hypothetical protein
LEIHTDQNRGETPDHSKLFPEKSVFSPLGNVQRSLPLVYPLGFVKECDLTTIRRK